MGRRGRGNGEQRETREEGGNRSGEHGEIIQENIDERKEARREERVEERQQERKDERQHGGGARRERGGGGRRRPNG